MPSSRKDRERRRTPSSSGAAETSSASAAAVEDDVGDDGLFVGFEHRMNTEQRRKMREKEKRGGDRSAGTRSTSRTSSSATTRSTSHSRPLERRERAERADRISGPTSSSARGPSRSVSDTYPTSSGTLKSRSLPKDDHSPPALTSSVSAAGTMQSPAAGSGERDRHRDRKRSSTRDRERDRSPRRTRSLRSEPRARSGSPSRAVSSSSHEPSRSRDSDDEERRRRNEERRAREKEERRAREERREQRRRERKEQLQSDEEGLSPAPNLDSMVRREQRRNRRSSGDDGGEERSVRSHKSSRSSSGRREKSSRDRDRDRHHRDRDSRDRPRVRSEEPDVPAGTSRRYRHRGASEDPGLRALNENEPMEDPDAMAERPRGSRYGRRNDIERSSRSGGSASSSSSMQESVSVSTSSSTAATASTSVSSTYSRTLERRQRHESEFRNRPGRTTGRSPIGRVTPDPFSKRHGGATSAIVSNDEDDSKGADGVLGDSTGPSSSESDDSDGSPSSPRRRALGGSRTPRGDHGKVDSHGVNDNQEESDDSDSGSQDGDAEQWTVRISVIKGVDLPFNAVPNNTPLCPILKIGLVKIPEGEEVKANVRSETTIISTSRSSALASPTKKSSIVKQLEESGLLSIPKSRVRVTSSRILSKKDKGEMEFHEEMRWDGVGQPEHTALAVELCARAAQTPPNYNESPQLKELPADAPVTGSPAPENFQLPGSFNRDWTRDRPAIGGLKGRGIGAPWSSSTAKNTRPGVGGDRTDDNTGSGLGADGSNRPSAAAPFSLMGRTGSTHNDTPEATETTETSTGAAAGGPAAAAPAGGMGGMAGVAALFNMGRRQLEQRRAATRRKEDEPGAGSVTTAATSNDGTGRSGNSNGAEGRRADGGTPNDSTVFPQSQQLGAQEVRGDVFGGTRDVGGRLPPTFGKRPLQQPTSAEPENVALVKPSKRRKVEMAEDMRLGTLIVPLKDLPLEKAHGRKEAVRIEQWYQLDSASNSLVAGGTRRVGVRRPALKNPSILLEISFSAPEVLDESEDELELDSETDEPVAGDGSALAGDSDHGGGGGSRALGNRSFSRRASNEMRLAQKATKGPGPDDKSSKDKKKKVEEDPVLEPGVVDFIGVVGPEDIGDQSNDDGSNGWVNSDPNSIILEQFPPNDTFHHQRGRGVTLQNQAEWFAFPEGCRLWRGAEPPSHHDLNLKRFSASSHPNVSSSLAAFDACLNCITSFSWFVIQSNEKENDFKNLKTYGAVIRFYAPAPKGIDKYEVNGTNANNAGTSGGRGTTGAGAGSSSSSSSSTKRLWVPMGIVMTSNLPIVGFMEAMLLRLCESLASRVGSGGVASSSHRRIQQLIHQDFANLIVNFQKPIAGVVHCSIPFLSGDRFHLTLPPPTGLPPLPHGTSVASVCRLLGAEGLNALLAAVLTESKILIHSNDIANLPMVAEVVTALVYPFVWSLPYLPVLPVKMNEFIEAPLSYFIGMPTCNLRLVDPEILSDIVVVDLDNSFTGAPDNFDKR